MTMLLIPAISKTVSFPICFNYNEIKKKYILCPDMLSHQWETPFVHHSPLQVRFLSPDDNQVS